MTSMRNKSWLCCLLWKVIQEIWYIIFVEFIQTGHKRILIWKKIRFFISFTASFQVSNPKIIMNTEKYLIMIISNQTWSITISAYNSNKFHISQIHKTSIDHWCHVWMNTWNNILFGCISIFIIVLFQNLIFNS